MTDQAGGIFLPDVHVTFTAQEAAELAAMLGVVLGQAAMQGRRLPSWTQEQEDRFQVVNAATMKLAESMAKTLLDAGLTPDQLRAATLGIIDAQQGHVTEEGDVSLQAPPDESDNA